MGQFATKRKNPALRLAALLLCLALMTSYMLGGILARFSSTASGEDGARVALFGQSATLKFDTHDIKPGDTLTIPITITNQSETGAVSEVAQSYTIEIKTAGDLPLKFKLDDKPGTQFSDDTWQTAANVAVSQSHNLTVTWPGDDNSTANDESLKVDAIIVNVNVTQID